MAAKQTSMMLIRIPRELHDEIRSIAARECESATTLARVALRRLVDEAKRGQSVISGTA